MSTWEYSSFTPAKTRPSLRCHYFIDLDASEPSRRPTPTSISPEISREKSTDTKPVTERPQERHPTPLYGLNHYKIGAVMSQTPKESAARGPSQVQHRNPGDTNGALLSNVSSALSDHEDSITADQESNVNDLPTVEADLHEREMDPEAAWDEETGTNIDSTQQEHFTNGWHGWILDPTEISLPFEICCSICYDSLDLLDPSEYLACTSNNLSPICANCVYPMFKSALRNDRTSFPPRCLCGLPIDVPKAMLFLKNTDFPEQLEEKQEVWASENPTWCATKSCSAFLRDGLFDDKGIAKCDNCESLTCNKCKQSLADHNGNDCPISLEEQLSNQLNAEKKNEYDQCDMRICPSKRCGQAISKDGGCNHMTCSDCGHEWCWLCAADWQPRGCDCPIYDFAPGWQNGDDGHNDQWGDWQQDNAGDWQQENGVDWQQDNGDNWQQDNGDNWQQSNGGDWQQDDGYARDVHRNIQW